LLQPRKCNDEFKILHPSQPYRKVYAVDSKITQVELAVEICVDAGGETCEDEEKYVKREA
jgi:hypothetical protein